MAAAGNGILLGLLLAVLVGPAFFALIQTSIGKGFVSALFMAFGIALSDALYIVITYLGISRIINNEAIHLWLGLGGGGILMAFGVFSIIKPIPDLTAKRVIPLKKTGLLKQSIKGFLLNGINPSVLLFWIGIVSMATVTYKYSSYEVLAFFIAIIATVLLTDILKAFVAHRLRALLTIRFMKIMNVIVGGGLILFGLRLLVETMI